MSKRSPEASRRGSLPPPSAFDKLSEQYDQLDSIVHSTRDDVVNSVGKRGSVALQSVLPSRASTMINDLSQSVKNVVEVVTHEATELGQSVSDAAASHLPKWVTESLHPEEVWLSHSFDEFELERSVWSAPIVLGLPPIGRAGSALMFSLLVLNTTIQVRWEPQSPPALRTSTHALI